MIISHKHKFIFKAFIQRGPDIILYKCRFCDKTVNANKVNIREIEMGINNE